MCFSLCSITEIFSTIGKTKKKAEKEKYKWRGAAKSNESKQMTTRLYIRKKAIVGGRKGERKI